MEIARENYGAAADDDGSRAARVEEGLVHLPDHICGPATTSLGAVMDDHWDPVRRELEIWSQRGLRARFWVRDDDAHELTAQLERLQSLASQHNIIVGLAIIPGKLRENLRNYVRSGHSHFHPMCHGWKHVNYGPKTRPAEFGRDRPLASLIEDAQWAYTSFTHSFRAQQPIFVPPFNRATLAFIRALPQIGFAAFSSMPSTYERQWVGLQARFNSGMAISMPRLAPVPRIDVHVDPIDWIERTALDRRIIATNIVRQLRARRNSGKYTGAPIGLLTHHLDHDEAIWRVCSELLALLRPHKAVEFVELSSWINENTKLSSEINAQLPTA
jgi:hypothetical protein